jgi:MerR family transcriptional regulator, copper efflux regulator
MTKYTIGQVSNIVNLPTKTIRFYEDQKIISAVHRADNGYREYTDKAIEELTLIKYARGLGLPISEIKKLMIGCEHNNCEHSRQNVITSIDNYSRLLTERIRQLSTLQMKLQRLKSNFCEKEGDKCNENKYCCNILGQLAEVA